MHRTAALKRLRAVLRRAGLRKVTLHSLRHSFASALIANGSSVVEVAALLGHSNATITLRVYSHFFPSAPSGSVAKLASAILGDGAARHQKDTLRVA
jgi:integrase